jgi:hypothetical protein
MSLLILTNLSCDYSGCTAAFEGAASTTTKASEVRKKAKEAGWQQVDSRDVCPEHGPPRDDRGWIQPGAPLAGWRNSLRPR